MPSKYTYVRKTFTYTGTRYEVKGKTEAEALTKMIQLQEELKRGEKTTGGNMTVARWFDEWMELYKEPTGLTPKSLGMYREKFAGYINPEIGRMKLKDVRDVHLQRILNKQAGMSYSHVTKLRAVMQQMFARARKSRLIPFDPAEDLELPRTEKNTRRSLTDAERAAFLAVEPTVKGGILYFTMLYTGMRPGELAGLQWRDVDFVRGEIHVSRALESGTWNTLKDPKTASGDRTIPLRPVLADRLRALRDAEPDFSPLAPVFKNQAGNMHSATTMRRLWDSILRAMDIHLGAELYRNQIVSTRLAPDLMPYCLRHTFCTDLQDAGVPINIAKELMGHSDIATTANIYTHRNQETLHSYVSLMDSPINRSFQNPVAK